MKSIFKVAIGGAAFLCAAQASAETIRVDGIYPAANDRAAALDSIAIEQFGGEDGGALSIIIEDRLRSVSIDGAQYFRILPASLASDAEAALRGSVSTRVNIERSSSKEVSTCVQRDDRRKCTERRKDRVPCERMTVSVKPSLRLISVDGALLHADDAAASREVRYCADQDQPPFEPLIEQVLEEIASRLRNDVAPTQRSDAIRLLESRRGMDKAAGRSFREAVEMTDRDVDLACQAFDGLEQDIGDHVSLLFNIGLCAESAGDLDRAEAYYRRAIQADSSKSNASAGLERMHQNGLGRQQLAARYGA